MGTGSRGSWIWCGKGVPMGVAICGLMRMVRTPGATGRGFWKAAVCARGNGCFGSWTASSCDAAIGSCGKASLVGMGVEGLSRAKVGVPTR